MKQNEKITHIDLFSGIGGASYAADQVWGKENVRHFFCDNEPFAQAILKKHWPEAKIYGDIRTLTNANHDGLQEQGTEQQAVGNRQSDEATRPFILTGGFPCQPFSQAGRRKGTDDDRYLWPEMLRVIREFKPQWVIGENVAGLLTWDEGVVLEQVCLDLEGEGYEVQPFVIPAVAVNAPHRRDRVWIVANARSGGQSGEKERNEQQGRAEVVRTDDNDGKRRSNKQNKIKEVSREGADASDGTSARGKYGRDGKQRNGAQRKEELSGRDAWNENWLEVATRLCTVDDGLPDGLARPEGWRNAALKGAGNAWVPQVAIEIMKAIKAADEKA